MNKQKLIEKINAIPWDEGLIVDTLKINRAGLIKLMPAHGPMTTRSRKRKSIG